MSDTGAAIGQFRTKAVVWAAICAGLLLVLIANSHLVYMAVDVATGLRRAYTPGRGGFEGRKVQRREVVMHAAMRLQGDRQ